jgi:hypothetical protein
VANKPFSFFDWEYSHLEKIITGKTKFTIYSGAHQVLYLNQDAPDCSGEQVVKIKSNTTILPIGTHK